MFLKVVHKNDKTYYFICIKDHNKWYSSFITEKQFNDLKNIIKVVEK